jgi:hypothetical protein
MSAMPHHRGNTPALMVTTPKPKMPTDAANAPPTSNAIATEVMLGASSPVRPPTTTIATPAKAATKAATDVNTPNSP